MWLYISVGVWHSCGITDSGLLKCWGCGGHDKLGRPIGISAWGESINKGQCSVPEGVAGWLSVSSGEYHTCAVAMNGSGYCWGCTCNPLLCPAWNSTDVDFGQCNVPPTIQWSHIAAGIYHSCGLTQEGIVLCWGALPNASLSFLNANGVREEQDPSIKTRFNYGQANPPSIEQWMNPALFASFGVYDNDILVLPVTQNSLPGSYYLFSFPVLNPTKQSPAVNLSIYSDGVELSAIRVTNAPDPLGPTRVVSCLEGTYDPERCIPCPAGRYAISCGVSTCASCNLGQYSTFGKSICTDCPVGTYADVPGSTICMACPQGTFGNVTGAVSAYDGCLACQPGKFSNTYHQYDAVALVWNVVGSTSCELCPKGYFCSGGSNKISCPSGTWSDSEGAVDSSVCVKCPLSDSCTNAWPYFTCVANNGFANDEIFFLLESCNKECLSLNNEMGQCVFQQGQNNGCSIGYDGPTCNRCGSNYYADFTYGKCELCPSNSNVLLSVLEMFAFAVAGFLLICEILALDWRVPAYFRSFLIFLQFQDLCLSVDTRWPDFVANYVQWLRILDFNIPSTNPECFIVNTASNWFFFYKEKILVPLIVLGACIVQSFVPFFKVFSPIKKAFSRWTCSVGGWYAIPFLLCLLESLNCICVPEGYELLKTTWNNCSYPSTRLVLNENPYLACSESPIQTAQSISIWILVSVLVLLSSIFLFIPQNQTPSKSGSLTLFNFGETYDRNNNIFGSGWMYKLEAEILQSKNLLESAKLELERIREIQLDEQAQGKKREFLQASQNYLLLTNAYEVYSDRHFMLSEMLEDLKEVLQLDMVFKNQELKTKQCQAIKICSLRLKQSMINFVYTVQYQKNLIRSAFRILNAAAFNQKKSWFHQSILFIKWTSLKRNLKKWNSNKDSFTKFTAEFTFWLCSGVLFPFAIIWIFSHWTTELLQSHFPPKDQICIKYIWATYGPKTEFEGQVVRVDPDCRNQNHFGYLRNKVALIKRGRGTMHESTLIKVDWAINACAAAVIIVNCGNSRFIPKVVAENFMLVRACTIPVIAISARDAQKIGNGSYVSINLKFSVKMIGLDRLNSFLHSSFCSSVLDLYKPEKRWFCILAFLRFTGTVFCCSLGKRYFNSQAYPVLFIQLVHSVLSLQCPYTDEGLNKIEIVSSFCCLFTALCVAAVTSILGQTSEGSAGLELQGTAGTYEDMIRWQSFTCLSYAIFIIFITTSTYIFTKMVQLLLEILINSAFFENTKIVKKISTLAIAEEILPEPHQIDSIFQSALHAISEHLRVLPKSSLCDCALGSVLGAISKQNEIEEMKSLIKNEKINLYPWVHTCEIGAAGFCQGKNIKVFLHRLSGCILEIAANSAGEIRFRPSFADKIYSLVDGMVWEREIFFSGKSAAFFETYIESYSGAVFATDFGCWKFELHTPDVEIMHQNKLIKIVLSRWGCAICIMNKTGVIIEMGCEPKISVPNSVLTFVETCRPRYENALMAVTSAQRYMLSLRIFSILDILLFIAVHSLVFRKPRTESDCCY